MYVLPLQSLVIWMYLRRIIISIVYLLFIRLVSLRVREGIMYHHYVAAATLLWLVENVAVVVADAVVHCRFRILFSPPLRCYLQPGRGLQDHHYY